MKKNNRKKHIRWNRVALLLLVFLFIMSFTVSALANSIDDKTENCSIVTVGSGDTLWDLIKENNPDYRGNMNEAVYETCKLNNMTTAMLQTGQTVLIPHL